MSVVHAPTGVGGIDIGLEDTKNCNAEWEPEKRVAPEDPEQSTERDVAPDGGYGWVCVACTFLINAHTWGVNSVRVRHPQRFNSLLMLY